MDEIFDRMVNPQAKSEARGFELAPAEVVDLDKTFRPRARNAGEPEANP